ncbi:MAG: ABC transporter substrate-binding protein, partial [Promethearchaeota archaeon]
NPSYGIFFHENLINNQPEIVEKFLVHDKKAVCLIRKAPARAAKMISQIFKVIDEEHVQSILRISPKFCIALPKEYISSTMQFIKVLHDLNYIKHDLEISDIFNFSFINKIHPEKHHYMIPKDFQFKN